MVIRESAKKINIEFRKSLSTAIITAFGLITALAWKDVITTFLNKITLSLLQGQVISAIIVTFISAIAIVIVTRITPSEIK